MLMKVSVNKMKLGVKILYLDSMTTFDPPIYYVLEQPFLSVNSGNLIKMEQDKFCSGNVGPCHEYGYLVCCEFLMLLICSIPVNTGFEFISGI